MSVLLDMEMKIEKRVRGFGSGFDLLATVPYKYHI